MVCKKCGHHSENSYGVCPYCGEVVKKSKGFTAGLVMLTVGICFVIVATVVVCGVVFSSTHKISHRVERYEENYAYNDVTHPALQAEPLPQEDYQLQSEPLPESKPKLKSEPIKEVITTVSEEKNKDNNTIKDKASVVKKAKPHMTFSSEIGVINGKTYAIRCVGDHVKKECYCGAGVAYSNMSAEATNGNIIPALPQALKADEMAFGSFCYYDGYVYYTEAEPGTGLINQNLYRCKSDFTEKELLAEWIVNYDGENDYEKSIEKDFVICDDVLYMNSYGYSIDLKTKKLAMREYPDYSQYSGTLRVRQVYFCDDKVFVCDDPEGQLCMYVSDECMVLVNDLSEFTSIDGYADGWLYYSVIVENGRYGELHRVNIETGKSEYVHKANVGGGYGPYFCF